MSQTNLTLRIGIKLELAILLGLLIALTVTIYVWTEPVVRTVLGLFCALLLPGYALTVALLPRNDSLTGIERIILCFGISIVVVSLIGLLLNYTPWGLRLEPVLISVSAFTLLCSGAAYYRRSRLSIEDRFVIHLELDTARWQSLGRWDRSLYAALALSIVAVIGALVYAIARPRTGERFTEFYVLGPDGMAADYPAEVTVGEPIPLIIGVVNHEHDEVQYRIEQVVGPDTTQVASPQLSHEEEWESPYTFALAAPGKSQKVVFLLYKDDDETPCRELHLWITVEDTTTEE